jgi:uncharacterized protein (DUF1501 family)
MASILGPRLPPGTRTFSRRELLSLVARGVSTAALAPSLVSLLARDALAQSAGRKLANKRLVLLWLEGGPSQLETWDPKPGTAVGGPTKGLATGVNGWLLSDNLPNLARRAGDLAVVRTMTSKEGNHSRARALVHCGYSPNPTVAFPSLGSIVAHEVGDLEGELPAFVQVHGAPISGGYLGIESSPFVVNDPTGKIENLSYANDVTEKRLDHREDMVDVLDAEFAKRGGESAVAANRSERKRARRLMDSKLLKAFDLDEEKESVRAAYGMGKFGQGVLLARRLLERGVSAVEVVLSGWDTHQDNFNRTKKLCDELDPAFATLIDDLKRRSLLKDTLIVCMGEFGRTPDIAPGDGRNHWPGNWCVALAGAGIKGGTAVGETDELGKKIASRPVAVADLFTTFAHVLKIEGDKTFHAGRRPIQLVDPNGKVVPELLT